MDLLTLYQSMKTIDEQSGLTRGFIIACRSTELFADICRITPDYSLIKEVTDYFDSPEAKERFKAIDNLKGEDRVFGFLSLIKNSHPKLMDLLTLLVIQLSYSLETKRNDIGKDLSDLMTNVLANNPEFESTNFSSKDYDDHALLTISRDYIPKGYKRLLALVYQVFKIQIHPEKKVYQTSKQLQVWKQYIFI